MCVEKLDEPPLHAPRQPNSDLVEHRFCSMGVSRNNLGLPDEIEYEMSDGRFQR